MRRIALINQKGGVGKTTIAANLGAALALAGKRVVVVDLDPQANLTLYLGIELARGAPSSYRVLTGEVGFGAALRPTRTPNLEILPTDLHLTGAELELSGDDDREGRLRAELEGWRTEHARAHAGEEPADYVLMDCPPSLGLLSLNALTAADEVFLVVQTHFLAMQGMSRLVEVIELVRQGLNPELKLSGIVACLYDSRMRLAREVLSELRRYFPAQVFRTPISSNIKLAESPSFGQTIFEYAPESIGARDFAALSREVLAQEVLPRPEAASAGPMPAPVPGSAPPSPLPSSPLSSPLFPRSEKPTVLEPAAPPLTEVPRPGPAPPAASIPAAPSPAVAPGAPPPSAPAPEPVRAAAPASAPRRERSKPASP